MKITHYITASGKNKDSLDVKVNQLIGEGWQPFGIAYTHKSLKETDSGTIESNPKFQPMVKYAEASE